MFFKAAPFVIDDVLSFLMVSTVQYGNFKQLKLGRPSRSRAWSCWWPAFCSSSPIRKT